MKALILSFLVGWTLVIKAQDTTTFIMTFDTMKVYTARDTVVRAYPTTFIFYVSGFTIWPWDQKLNLFLVPGSEADPYPFRCWDDLQELVTDSISQHQGVIYRSVTTKQQLALFWSKKGLWVLKPDHKGVFFSGLRH